MKVRLANNNDLPVLYVLFKDLTAKMTNEGIKIWNEYYPYFDFETDIENSRLYVVTEDNAVVATFTLYDNTVGQECISWTEPESKAVYISHLGVDIHHLRQGIGNKCIDYMKDIALSKGAKYLRLMVADINTPAVALYTKNGFKKRIGTFHEESEMVGTTIHENGYEIRL